MATQQQTSSVTSQIRSTVSPLPITLGGISMGSTGPGQPSVQFLVLRPPIQTGVTNRGLQSLARVTPTQGLTPRYITIAPARPGTPGNKVSISPLQNGQNQSSSSSSPGTPRIFLVSSTVDESQEKPDLDLRPPSGYSVRVYQEENAASKEAPKRGRKRMTDLEKAEAKKEREKSKAKDGGAAIKKKRQGRRAKKTVGNATNDFTAEINDLRQKIHGRYDKHKRANVKKEEVGYFGPYIRTYLHSEADKNVALSTCPTPSGVPVPNFIVDTFEAHLQLPDAKKSRYKLEKQSGVPLEGPFVCFFCHLDPSAERETAMGDLIGPISYPSSRTGSRRDGIRLSDEEKRSFFSHEKCLEWASNFRMIGYEIVELDSLLEDAKSACAVCKRRGATIGCSAPVLCKKTFHYPCAKLSGCKLVKSSHQVYCTEHKDVTTRKHGYEKEMIMAEVEIASDG